MGIEEEPTKFLASISKARQYLAEARDITEVLDIRDAAVAALAYAHAKNAEEAAQMAMEIKLRSERKAGEFLRDDPNIGSGKGSTLEPLGIDKKESHRWQRIALIPEERFEYYIVNATRRTQAALLIEAAREISPKPSRILIDYPEGKYGCIVIDPPWPIRKIEREVAPDQGLYLDYPTLSLEEIADIPIPELAFEEGCHVYLWVTQKYLPYGIVLFEEWGVKYQCLLTWVKPGGFAPFSWMYNTEHVLFGRIGTLPLLQNGIKLSFNEPTREHSRKPDIFYDIVKQVSPSPRLELFARQEREGFDVWGNEIDKFGG